MADVAATSIPVPRVPSPRISAPDAARDPGSFIPVPRQGEGPLAEVLEGIPRFIPDWAIEGMFRACRNFNRVIFRSSPPGAPQPVQPDSWSFAAIGDYGGGRQPLTDVARNLIKGRPGLVLTTGDNVYYHGTEEEYQQQWDPPQYFGDVRSNLPVMPTLGNHDTSISTKPYFDRFPELNGARFYSFTERGVHFTTLDTNESIEPGSPQYRWLEQDLASSNEDWKVLYFHHPMFSGFPGITNPATQHLAPLIARYGVDLVLTGHEHNYSRSTPLNANGTIEVITGNGGHSLHPFISSQPERIAYRDVDFGHVEFEVRKDELVGRYVVRDGSVRDTFVIPNSTPGVRDAAAGAAAVQPAVKQQPAAAAAER